MIFFGGNFDPYNLLLPNCCCHGANGETRGGELCFYINEGWCSDVTTLKKMWSPNLEALFINCEPFYSPREFSSFIVVNVYVPPDICVSVMQQLAWTNKQRYTDSVLIILWDFNKTNLSRELPKYRQHVKCPTRDSNILDHCYTAIKDITPSHKQLWGSLITVWFILYRPTGRNSNQLNLY